jgi:two-component system sensor histidine kinase KdpD
MEQLLVNLLENAIRHTPEGTRVIVTARPGDWTATPGPASAVIIEVMDDGPGITAALAERMFQPHERGLTVAPGAGLGLTIARGIVDAHGGQLSWRPTPTGTCFEVILPVDPPADNDTTGTP